MEFSLCLIGLLKNDEKQIENCLLSYLPLIDQYYFIDVGSTDQTIEKVKDFFQKNQIPGSISKQEWVSFKHNYNQLLEEVYQLNKRPTHLWLFKHEFICTHNRRPLLRRDKQRICNQIKVNSNQSYKVIHHDYILFNNVIRILVNDNSKIYKGNFHEYLTNKNEQPILSLTIQGITSHDKEDLLYHNSVGLIWIFLAFLKYHQWNNSQRSSNKFKINIDLKLGLGIMLYIA